MKKYFITYFLIILLLTSCKGKTYKVTFVDVDQELASINVKKGDNLKDVDVPSKDGYIFVSWLLDGIDYDVNTPITEDITLSAKWTEAPDLIKNHTVTFNFGDTLKTQTVADGEKANKPANDPVKEKHEFLGWYVGETLYDFDAPVTKDIVIAAKFKRNRVVINYDLDGGTGSTVSVEIDKDSIPDKPKTPTKFGYNFVNWMIDGKEYNFDYSISEDTTIKAMWEATVYVKVTFDTDGGNNINSEMLPKGSLLTNLPTPIKDGYSFKYWSLNNNKFDINSKIDDDIVLIAVYEENIISDEEIEKDS